MFRCARGEPGQKKRSLVSSANRHPHVSIACCVGSASSRAIAAVLPMVCLRTPPPASSSVKQAASESVGTVSQHRPPSSCCSLAPPVSTHGQKRRYPVSARFVG